MIESSWKLRRFGVLKAREQREDTWRAGTGPFPVWACLLSHICLSFFFILSGIIGERLPIRYYLTFGMLASGAFTALFGLGYFYDIHSFGFYVVTQVRSGSVAHCVRGLHAEPEGVSVP